MAISAERDTATHQPRIQRLGAGAAASPGGPRSLPRSSVCGACVGRGREARRSRARRAVPRSAGSGSGERAPPALRACPPSAAGAGPPSSTQPGRAAAATAAGPSPAAGSHAATSTRAYVEFDDLEWDKREWVKVYEDFSAFLVEYHLIWARRNSPSQTQGSKSKQIQWPALVRPIPISLSIFSWLS